jgi:sugar lactone lactonase YvrE
MDRFVLFVSFLQEFIMSVIAFIIQCLVAAGFLVRAASKFLATGGVRREFEALRVGRYGRWSLAALEMVGGLGMLAALVQPFLVFFVAVFLVLLSAWTLVLQRVRQFTKGSSVVAVLLVGALAAAALQPLGLKVILLPKAADLPLEPVASSQIVKSYEEGLWFEGVAMAPDGTLYLAGNKGENYATGDKSRVRARVIARAPDGGEQVFFNLPPGSTAGVITFDAQGHMYMTGQGADLGVWRLTPDGKGELFAKMPRGAWPNGITAGPDGQLYVADSSLGVIWRVDPRSGAVGRALESDALRARPLIALAPGANGVHFFGRDLYVTVSDAARILKFSMNADGQFGAPSVFAEGIPGDDFAIDDQGTLFVTTHPFNTIVQVTQDGRRSVVANAAHGIVGATDAVFGVLPGDRDTLYVATDGGAFSGDAGARGTLVTLKVKH